MNPLSQEEAGFDERMRDELSLLQEKVDAGNTESSFPWARYHHLKREEHEYAQRFRVVKRPYPGDDSIENIYAQIQEQEEDVAPSTVAPPATSHAPLTESAPTTTSKKQVVVPSLESLCKGGDDEQRREYAAKIDAMWFNIKNQSLESNYRTACVAVYKLAEWLGMVHSVKSSEWTATLLARYGIPISEALSKYKIAKPPKSKAFREAVVISFTFSKGIVFNKAKNNPLPPIYQNIPAATSKYQK